MLKLHTISRDKLYEAKAVYDNGFVTVLKGSRVNIKENPNFKPSIEVQSKLNNIKLVGADGILKNNVTFKSLSTAATFVTGRISNGMITWKTDDGKYVGYTLKPEKYQKDEI